MNKNTTYIMIVVVVILLGVAINAFKKQDMIQGTQPLSYYQSYCSAHGPGIIYQKCNPPSCLPASGLYCLVTSPNAVDSCGAGSWLWVEACGAVATNWTYQENSNQHDCVLTPSESMGGIYNCYTYISQYDSLFDGNWYTDAYKTTLDIIPITMNYNKPANAQSSSIWQVKDGCGTENLSLPSGCWGQSPIQLEVTMSQPRCDWNCWNGGSWVTLRTCYGQHAYEEAMWWYTGGTPTPTTCTLPWGGTINNGQQVNAYSVSSAVTCPGPTIRTCTNGNLDGTGNYSTCTNTCTDSSWSPLTTVMPCGQSFIETSNCGHTNTATGTFCYTGTCNAGSCSVPCTPTCAGNIGCGVLLPNGCGGYCPIGTYCATGTCQGGLCSGGNTCQMSGDSNHDCTIIISEVMTLAKNYMNGQGATITQVMAAAKVYMNGGAYTL